MVRELLIGCGAVHKKLVYWPGKQDFQNLTTIDINPDHNPDVVHDLNDLPLPFPDNHFNEIHAYEVLEHCGRQGDYKFFFDQFSDFWRILKPGCCLFASCPSWDSKWAWGDPSHTRIISQQSITFLSQKQYEKQVGDTHMSDFRYLYKADFELAWHETNGESFRFALAAIK